MLAQRLDDRRRDTVLAARMLRRAPGFTTVAVLTLALGIGANTAVFSVVNAVLLRSLPYKDPDRLVRIFGSVPAGAGANGPSRRVPGVRVSDLAELRAQAASLSDVVFYLGASATLTGLDQARKLDGIRIAPEAFPMLGAVPLIGRTFEPREAAAGADGVVILSFRAWQRYFNGALQVLGRQLRLDDRSYEVVGVMPPAFQFPDAQTEFWVPFVATDFPQIGGSPIARLKDDVSLDAAAAEVTSILVHLHEAQPPRLGAPPAPPQYELVRIKDEIVAPVRPALLVLAAAVGFVLLIGCVNVANLVLARTAARRRDIAIRLAVGASRGRLIAQALTESVLLSLVGGAAGALLAVGGVRLLRILGTSLPRRDIGAGIGLPRLDEVGVDASVLLFTLVISVATGIAFGLLPALRFERGSGAMDVLRDGAASATSGFNLFGRHRVQAVLVIAEMMGVPEADRRKRISGAGVCDQITAATHEDVKE